MTGFYQNLLTRNVALGAVVEGGVGLSAKIKTDMADSVLSEPEKERERREESRQQARERAKRDSEIRERLARNVEFREIPGVSKQLSEEEVYFILLLLLCGVLFPV